MAHTTTLVPLSPRDKSPAAGVGCLLVLALFLSVIGWGLVAVFIVDPSGKGDMWVMPLVGGGFGLVGTLLLYGGVRGARGLKVPPADVAVEGGATLAPGATVRVAVRQRGPVEVESLKLRVSCDRVYQRRVKANSSATVEDHETLWEANLVEVANQEVRAGDTLEREATLAVPRDAPSSGPAQPDGTIRWQMEVFVEAGLLRATYRAFDLHVRAAAADR